MWRWLKGFTMRDGNPKTDELPPYNKCMNCGSELVGMYCHKCGQYASPPSLKMSEFIKEYFRNILSAESQLLPTLSNLIFHPGRVAKLYSEGRHVSFLHPLKINLFILVVLITIFSFVGTDDKVITSFRNLTDKEAFTSKMLLDNLQADEEFMARVDNSPLETITLVSSGPIVEEFPRLVTIRSVVSSDKTTLVDTLVVSVPSVLIEEKVLVAEDDVYRFDENREGDTWVVVAEMVSLWEKSISLIFAHFPLFMLLTTPLFVFPLRRLLRKRNIPSSNFYIFALYYIAFVELLLTVLFLCGLMFDFSSSAVTWYLMAALLLYLAVALKNAFEIKSWVRSMIYAVVVDAVYLLNTLLVIMVLSMVFIIVKVI